MGEDIERDFFEENQRKVLAEVSAQSDEEKHLACSSKMGDVDSYIHEPFDIKIKIKILILQNTGILLGFSFMLFMALFSDRINL